MRNMPRIQIAAACALVRLREALSLEPEIFERLIADLCRDHFRRGW